MSFRTTGLLMTVVLAARPSPAAAQTTDVLARGTRWFVLSSYQTAGVYEDNVFFTAEGSEVDAYFLRMTPNIEARYRGTTRSFQAGFNFDTEIYSEKLEELNDVFARQSAFVEYESDIGERSTWSARASYLLTRRPEEVLAEAGLVSVRRRSQKLDANLNFIRNLTPRWRLWTAYAFNNRRLGRKEDVLPGSLGTLHSFSTEFSYGHSERTASALIYVGQLFLEDEITPVLAETNGFASHVLAYRFSRDLTPRLRLTLLAGPRLSENLEPADGSGGVERFRKTRELKPEALASLSYRNDSAELSVSYSRSQYQAFGLTGFVQTDRLAFEAKYHPNETLSFEATPAVFRNARARSDATSLLADFSAKVRIRPWLSADVLYRVQFQDGLLLLFNQDFGGFDRISRNTVFFGLTASKLVIE